MGCCGVLLNRIKRFVSPPGQTPLDPKLVVTIFLVNVASAMVVTMPFSFLPQMMRSFGIAESQIGANVGLVASSLYFGRSFGSYVWGWLSDNIGRRKAVLMTEVLLLICTLLFGFSNSISWAFATRFSQGAFGGLIVTLKAVLFAICDETNNSFGMALIVASFQIGLIVGPAIGGYLAAPAEQYPSTFSKDSIFGKYQFLLPLMINSFLLAIGFLMSIYTIPETLKINSEEAKLLKSGSSPVSQASMETSTPVSQPEHKRLIDIYAYDVVFSKESYTVLSSKPDYRTSSNDGSFGEDAISISHIQLPDETLSYGRSSSFPFSGCCKTLKELAVWKLLRSRNVQLSLWLYFMHSFISFGFSEVYPVFADSSRAYGGLAFSSSEIGTSLLFSAVPMIVLVFFMARLTKRFGEKMVFITTLYIMMFVLPLFPYSAVLPDSYVWYLLIPLLLLQKLSMSTGFLAVNVLLNESADAEYMGLVNGIGMMVSSVGRAVSPLVLGALYSWSLGNEGQIGYPFNHCFAFVLIGFMALLTLFSALFLPEKLSASPLEVDSNSLAEEDKANEGSHEVSTETKA